MKNKLLYLIVGLVLLCNCSTNCNNVSLGQELFKELKNETNLRFDFNYFKDSEQIDFIKTFNNEGSQIISEYNFSDRDLDYFQYEFHPAGDFKLTVIDENRYKVVGTPFVVSKVKSNLKKVYCSFANPYFIETTVSLISNQELEPFFVKTLSLEDHALMIDINDETNVSIIVEMRNKSDNILFNKTYNLTDLLPHD
tara:strand:+ start:963 stop:1550 length:588 start_codon:yes stop_codon:yes gene_type:complete